MSEQTQSDWNKYFSKLVKCETNFTLDHIAEAVFSIVLDEASLGVCFAIHRDAKTGALEAEGLDDSVPLEFCLVDQPGRDVLGQPLAMKRPPDAQCPICQRNIACTRFAPHLEKCVGLGRNSSRLASRRIANNQLAASVGSDDDADEDWSLGGAGVMSSGGGGNGGGGDRRKKRREKISPRRSKVSRRCVSMVTASSALNDKDSDTRSNLSNASSSAPSTPEQALQYEQLSEQERRDLFNQVCGVIAEGTRHMCTRSVRCQQHSEDQRRSVRVALFGDCAAVTGARCTPPLLEGTALSDSLNRLWDRASRASSPSDSGSGGTLSTGSKGRRAAAGPRVKKSRAKAINESSLQYSSVATSSV